MPATPAPAKVLVTGASGFLGAHVARAFLARGYSVRGTVRSTDKGDYLLDLFSGEFPNKFEYYIVKDIGEVRPFVISHDKIDMIADNHRGPDSTPACCVR